MEDKAQEVIVDSPDFLEQNYENEAEYLAYMKSTVKDGSYFRDALNWYFFRYVTPICDRTMLIFGAMIAAVVLFFLYNLIKGAFPLVSHIPIIISAKDQAEVFPQITPLRPHKGKVGYDEGVLNIEEAIAKYLLKNYVMEREGYDFSKGEIEDVNKKFNRVRNMSSDNEYKAFQAVMNKDNPNSPILDFGRNVKREVQVSSVVFKREEQKTLFEKAQKFLISEIPTQAEVRFALITKIKPLSGEVKVDKQLFMAKINFSFDGIKNANGTDKQSLNFGVNGYKLFKVRN